jgi:peroxiredoxin
MALLHSQKNALEKGAAAPQFTLKNVNNTNISLSDFKGKPLCIIFMCNHCPYVIPKFEEIGSLQKKGVPILCICSNDGVQYPADSFENMQVLAKEQNYAYYLHDEDQDVVKQYGAVCTPDAFVFDAEHTLAYHGRINDAMDPEDVATEYTLSNVLDSVIAGKSLDRWFIPSQGCSIKWK